MGETSADTQREIESIRDDVSAIVAELEGRARRLVDFKAQAEDHPAALGVLGFGVLAGAAVLGYNAVSDYRESRKPVNRLKRRAGALREDVGERLGRARESMPYGVSVQRSRSDEPADASSKDPGMVKSLLWMALTAGTIAVFGLLARRVSSAIWEAIMREPPPTRKV